jgi:hypothetical protein
MGLGSVHTVGLAEARSAAQDARKALLNGEDPIEMRRVAQSEKARTAAATVTFEEAAKSYIAAHRASWKNKAHASQWPSSLTAYAYPIIGKVSIAAIDIAQVLKVLEPIWHTVPDTAGRVRGRIELVLDWAKARGHRKGDKPITKTASGWQWNWLG